MSKSFTLKKIESDRFLAVSFSLDAKRPEEYFALLERQLGKLGEEGLVLLDLLACNGATSRRYMTIPFVDCHLDLRGAKLASPDLIGGEILSYCRNYYAKNADKLVASVLSPAARHKLAQQQAQSA